MFCFTDLRSWGGRLKKIIKLGRKLVTVEGKLYNAENKLAATLLHTIQPSEPPEGANPFDTN